MPYSTKMGKTWTSGTNVGDDYESLAGCTFRGGRAGGLGFETLASTVGVSAMLVTWPSLTGDTSVSFLDEFARAGELEGLGRGSSELRLLLSLETIDCNAALAGDEVPSSSGESFGGSDITCTA